MSRKVPISSPYHDGPNRKSILWHMTNGRPLVINLSGPSVTFGVVTIIVTGLLRPVNGEWTILGEIVTQDPALTLYPRPVTCRTAFDPAKHNAGTIHFGELVRV